MADAAAADDSKEVDVLEDVGNELERQETDCILIQAVPQAGEVVARKRCIGG